MGQYKVSLHWLLFLLTLDLIFLFLCMSINYCELDIIDHMFSFWTLDSVIFWRKLIFILAGSLLSWTQSSLRMISSHKSFHFPATAFHGLLAHAVHVSAKDLGENLHTDFRVPHSVSSYIFLLFIWSGTLHVCSMAF